MPGLHGSADFAALARRLKDAGETGLRRRLYKAISDSADPLARKLRSAAYLKPYMPDRYAETLAADLAVTVYKRAGANPSISVRAESPRPRNRKVIQVNAGLLRHPLFGDREHWYLQLRGMRPGFFDDAVAETGQQIKDSIGRAMDDTARQITKG
jgi:hypothetical protein